MRKSDKQTQDWLTLRLPRQTIAKFRKASALAGTSLNQYILAGEATLTIPDDVFDRFMAACADVDAPNAALQKAATALSAN